MKEEIEKIKENSIWEITKCDNLKTLNDLKVKYLGKKGELTTVLRKMGELSPEERPVIRRTSKQNQRWIRKTNWIKRKRV